MPLEMTRLQRSLRLLRQTNAMLLDSISSVPYSATPVDQSLELEKQEYSEIITENQEAIAKQEERVKICKWVLQKKLGLDPGNKHYDLDTDTTAITVRNQGPSVRTNGSIIDVSDDQETSALREDYHDDQDTSGVYL